MEIRLFENYWKFLFFFQWFLLSKMLRLAQRFSRQFSTVAKRALENDEASSSSGGGAGKDIAKLFTNTKVQTLLRQLTGCDFDRLFRFRQIEDAEERPSYQLLTDEELKEVFKQSVQTV